MENRKSDFIQMREFFESRLDGLQILIETRLTAIERTTTTALESVDRRLSYMEGLKEELRTSSERLATKVEMERLAEEVVDLNKFRHTLEGKASQRSVTGALIVAGIGTLISISSLMFSVFALIIKVLGIVD